MRFPRQGDETNGNTVTITAPKAVAEKIRAALEKEVASLKSRVVWGVVVPHTLHASVIGKGASALQELQRKHGVKVIMPGWNDYAQTGEVANPDDVKDAPAGDIVKLVGPREAAIAAAEDLSVRPPLSPGVDQTLTTSSFAEGTPEPGLGVADDPSPQEVPRQDRSRRPLLPLAPERHPGHPRRREAATLVRQEQEAASGERRRCRPRTAHRRRGRRRA